MLILREEIFFRGNRVYYKKQRQLKGIQTTLFAQNIK